jgi:hypothetical protein
MELLIQGVLPGVLRPRRIWLEEIRVEGWGYRTENA